ncbi:DUF2642 domain-containing protein [Ralstonia pickettii]|nr:DUF2642 domain-containing protein [Ralstonia pickettii]
MLNLINQMSQNTTSVIRTNSDFAIDFPSVDLNIDLGGISTSTPPETPPTDPTTPSTLRELLLTLVNEQVQVTTPFGAVSGLLLAVRDDYIVLVEEGSQVLVRTEQIELVSEL